MSVPNHITWMRWVNLGTESPRFLSPTATHLDLDTYVILSEFVRFGGNLCAVACTLASLYYKIRQEVTAYNVFSS
jgi:hypothetical protein